MSPAFNFCPTLQASVEASSRAADKMLETHLLFAALPAHSQNHLRLLLRRRYIFKGIHGCVISFDG